MTWFRTAVATLLAGLLAATACAAEIAWEREIPLVREESFNVLSVAVSDTMVFRRVNSANRTWLVAWSRETGEVRWIMPSAGTGLLASSEALINVVPQPVATGRWDVRLQALSPTDGSMLWEATLAASVGCWPCYGSLLHAEAGRVYLLNAVGENGPFGFDASIEARSLADGSVLWQRLIPNVSHNDNGSQRSGPSVVHDGRLVLPLRGKPGCRRCGALYAFDVEDGDISELWSHPEPSDRAFIGAYADGLFAIGYVNWAVALYDLEANTLLWQIDQGANGNGVYYDVNGITLGPGGDVFVTDTIHESLSKYAAGDGSLAWRNSEIEWDSCSGSAFQAPSMIPLPHPVGTFVMTRTFVPGTEGSQSCSSDGSWRPRYHLIAADGTHQGEFPFPDPDLVEMRLEHHDPASGLAMLRGLLGDHASSSLISFDVPTTSVAHETKKIGMPVWTESCGQHLRTDACVDGDDDVLGIARSEFVISSVADRTALVLLDAATGETLPFPRTSPMFLDSRPNWLNLGADHIALGAGDNSASGGVATVKLLSLDSDQITTLDRDTGDPPPQRSEEVVVRLPDGTLLSTWSAYDSAQSRYCTYAEGRDIAVNTPHWSTSYCDTVSGRQRARIALESDSTAWLAYTRLVLRIDLATGTVLSTTPAQEDIEAITAGDSGELWTYQGNGGARRIELLAAGTGAVVQSWDLPGRTTELTGFAVTGTNDAVATQRDFVANTTALVGVRRDRAGIAWQADLRVDGFGTDVRAAATSGASVYLGGCVTDETGDRAVLLRADPERQSISQVDAFDAPDGKCIHALEATPDGVLVAAERRFADPGFGSSSRYSDRVFASRIRRDDLFASGFETR